MLCLKTKGIVQLIGLMILTDLAAIEKVAGIKLNAWFGGPDFHYPAGRWFMDHGRLAECAHPSLKHPVVIVAMSKLQLFVVLIYSQADCSRFGKVEGRAPYTP